MKKIIYRYGVLFLGILFCFIDGGSGIFLILGIILLLLGLLVASKSSMLGYGSNMHSISGIGTTLYGKSQFNQSDKSYISTKYFVFLMLPICPIASYRVRQGETTQKFIGTNTSYEMKKVPLSIGQIMRTYAMSWGILIVVIIFYLYS